MIYLDTPEICRWPCNILKKPKVLTVWAKTTKWDPEHRIVHNLDAIPMKNQQLQKSLLFFNNGSRSSIFFPEKVYRQKVNRPKQQWLKNSHLNIKLCWFLCPMFFDWEGISTSDLYKLLRYLFCPEKAAWHLSVTPVPPPPVGWLVVGPLRTVEFHWVSQATLVPHAWHWHHPGFFSRGKFTNDEMMDFSTIFCAGAYKTFMWLIHFFNGRYD